MNKEVDTSEFKSFFKSVQGNEGDKCRYNTRLDTYGCGCQHNCSYCYARSLLHFRGFWNADQPKAADIRRIARKVNQLSPGTIIRLGGMTDCFQPCEQEQRVTYHTILEMNRRRVGYRHEVRLNCRAGIFGDSGQVTGSYPDYCHLFR